MRRFLFIALFTFHIISYSQIYGRIIKVFDGDTVLLLDNENNQLKIRVADIDCPEYKQPFSKVAKKFTSKQIFGKYVRVLSKGKDKYGRVIGFIKYDSNKDLSEELLKNGLAWHYSRYSTSEYFIILETQAKENRIGLWVQDNPIAPWNYRRLRN